MGPLACLSAEGGSDEAITGFEGVAAPLANGEFGVAAPDLPNCCSNESIDGRPLSSSSAAAQSSVAPAVSGGAAYGEGVREANLNVQSTRCSN
jgi:hypothetical protein